MKKTKGQETGTCTVWGLVKVLKLVGLLQNVMKELAEIRKMLKEGARSNGR